MPFQQLFKEGINFRFKLFILNLVRAYLRTCLLYTSDAADE